MIDRTKATIEQLARDWWDCEINLKQSSAVATGPHILGRVRQSTLNTP